MYRINERAQSVKESFKITHGFLLCGTTVTATITIYLIVTFTAGLHNLYMYMY